MELIQEIGSYAGLAAIPGLAILSALYFSQARDVRRLREWAGRAPERAAAQQAQQAQPAGRTVTRPAAQPGTQAAPQPVRSGAAAAASATGAGGATATASPPRTGAAAKAGAPKPIAPRIPPGTPAGQTSILRPGGEPPRERWYRRLAGRLPAARYIAIILVGIAVVGGGVAFGITQLGNEDAGSPEARTGGGDRARKAEEASPPPVKPADVSVTVLNGTTVTGLAHNIGSRLSDEGYQLENQLTATEGGVAESVVLYKPGASREAQLVAKELDISQIEPADSNATAQGGAAEVIVLVGADLAQR